MKNTNLLHKLSFEKFVYMIENFLGFKELYASRGGSMLFGVKYLFEYKKNQKFLIWKLCFPLFNVMS